MERREKNWKEIKIGGQKEEEREEMRNEKMRRKRRE